MVADDMQRGRHEPLLPAVGLDKITKTYFRDLGEVKQRTNKQSIYITSYLNIA